MLLIAKTPIILHMTFWVIPTLTQIASSRIHVCMSKPHFNNEIALWDINIS